MKPIGFGREVTSHLEAALAREWLVTNGIGGYACGTVAGANTRRFHGLLVAALTPPRPRLLLVSKLEATARLEGDRFALTTNEYVDGTINPHGYLNLESFRLEGTIPVFTWAVADNLLKQRIWMVHGQNSTYVTYTLVRASTSIALEIIPLCTYREAWGTTDIRGWMPNVRSMSDGLRVDAQPSGVPYWVRANRGAFVPGAVRHWSLRHRGEGYRGLDDCEDLFAVGRMDVRLAEGETLALLLTVEPSAEPDWQRAYTQERERQARLLATAELEQEPDWVRQLLLAADQFVVNPTPPESQSGEELPSATLLTSYPWSEGGARDTLIALPGISLASGRPQIAAGILRAATRAADEGLLPDCFLDPSQPAAIDNADAALWLFYVLHHYLFWTGDWALAREIYPGLVEILEWHRRGTRLGIGMDEADGLLRVGGGPVGLTWMNAQDGDWIVTPRTGKPVEVNALWYNGLATLAALARELGEAEDATLWQQMAGRVADSFSTRFWYEAGGYLFDVVDGPEGVDVALRPNQILAVSLPHAPVTDPARARSVVLAVARYLHTSYGLRSLSPHDPAFVPRHGGNHASRARAAHQGTVWSWLIGPFVNAYLNVYGDREQARSFLRPIADHLADGGLGSVSQIFDGNPPHTPRGCIASAPSVGQILCGWLACGDAPHRPQPAG
jgi:predicted glycogen debranching enzyme